MYRIAKSFTFSAAHHLEGVAPDHRCARPHGHNYTVEVELAADELVAPGWVRDYGDLSIVRDWLDRTFEHRDLNEATTFNPTAENLARALYDVIDRWFPNLAAVRVSETDRTWAEYRR